VNYYFTIALNFDFELVWGEMCCKGITNLKHKTQLVNQYSVSPIATRRTLPESLVMAKKQAAPRTHAIQNGM